MCEASRTPYFVPEQSTALTEPHLADPMLSGPWVRASATIMVMRDAPEYTSVTGGVVVVVMVIIS